MNATGPYPQEGRTPLHRAALRNQPDVVRDIVSSDGASDVESKDKVRGAGWAGSPCQLATYLLRLRRTRSP